MGFNAQEAKTTRHVGIRPGSDANQEPRTRRGEGRTAPGPAPRDPRPVTSGTPAVTAWAPARVRRQTEGACDRAADQGGHRSSGQTPLHTFPYSWSRVTCTGVQRLLAILR